MSLGRLSSRPLAPTLLLTTLLLTAVILAPPGSLRAEEDRSTRVLERVQAAVHAPQTAHFNSRNVQLTELVRTRAPEAGRSIYVPSLPPGCGMGVFGGLDVEAALRLAVDLFALYGFDLQPDLAAAGVRLDGLDPEAKVALLIQPAVSSELLMPIEDGSTKERIALERAQYRVLVLPASRYRCMQADSSSPLHAAALTMLEFLAEASGTRPVDASVLAQGESVDVAGTGLGDGVAGASTFQLTDAGAFLVLEKDATVELGYRPSAKIKGRGRPTLVSFPFYWTPPQKADGSGYDFEQPSPAFTLLQDGIAPLASGRAVFLTSEEFDPAKPFRISVTLRPGQTHIGSTVRVRTSSAKRR